jgi:signal transduction histidine kinase
MDLPDSSVGFVMHEARREWVGGPDSWLILDADGALLESTADSGDTRRVLAAWAQAPRGTTRLDLPGDGRDLRVVRRTIAASRGLPSHTILAVGSTEAIKRDTELLGIALAVATPLIALASLAAGYVLARWALRPADVLGRAIDALGPASPGARLPVSDPADEIGLLAARFNALLDRLAESQAQNRDFVREAAHQIRTPLTLVRGEAEHALAATVPDVDGLKAALGRVERASRQMQHRVDELLLLAEAEAGAVLERRVPVELDGLALEGVDLFRARAAQLERPLAYGTLEPTVVLGDETLLREALLELLENACRHGPVGTPITVFVRRTLDGVDLVVESSRGPIETTLPEGPRDGSGIGQRIVQWIAQVHDGRFTVVHDASERYAAVLSLPVAPAVSTNVHGRTPLPLRRSLN